MGDIAAPKHIHTTATSRERLRSRRPSPMVLAMLMVVVLGFGYITILYSTQFSSHILDMRRSLSLTQVWLFGLTAALRGAALLLWARRKTALALMALAFVVGLGALLPSILPLI